MIIPKSVGREPVAITGIGCRFPGGINSAKELWDALLSGLDTITEVPPDRFDASAFHDSSNSQQDGSILNRNGGFIDDVHGFDADFFGLLPGEASCMDPQQRMVLEASVHALEDSGVPLHEIAGTTTGVFVGGFMYDHLCMQTEAEHRDTIGPHMAMGTSNCSIANRVSHRLDLRGASMTLDTACSSSLVSVHLACQSIWAGESEGALAGGVNAILRPESSIVMSNAGFLSPDGHCKPFDAAADGYVRSEGVGIIYLQPLSRAIQNGDRIYATILGSLVNSDGFTPEGLTVPSLESQKSLLRTLYSKHGIPPSAVRCVEAHGPGTARGDPVEARAIGEELGMSQRFDNEPLFVTSIKANLGHLEGASGVAGLIKAALMVFHRRVPPQIKHVTPNPNIPFSTLGLQVSTSSVELKEDPNRDVVMGVNSFGAGGTNAHVILEGFRDTLHHKQALESSEKRRIFIVAAHSPSALRALLQSLLALIKKAQPSAKDLAYSLASRRTRHRCHVCIVAGSIQELSSQLAHLASAAEPQKSLNLGRTLQLGRMSERPRVAFAFSGQGGQWARMGASLMETEPAFREALSTFDSLFKAASGTSILEELLRDKEVSHIHRTGVVQPAITAIQIALARTLMHYGLVPEAVVGHSIGEVAAAHISGALSLDQTVAIIHKRSSIQEKAAGLGTMLAVALPEANAVQAIQRHHAVEHVSVAALNGPEMTVISGHRGSIDKIAIDLKEQGIFARHVNVDVPYHSHYIDSLKADFLDCLSSCEGTRSSRTLYSSVTTKKETGTHLNAEYWYRNAREPVRFVETANRMMDDGHNMFIEVGPHPVLITGMLELAKKKAKGIDCLPAMLRNKDVEQLAMTIGSTYAAGVDSVKVNTFNGGGEATDIPLYPFQHQTLHREHPDVRLRRLKKGLHPFEGGPVSLTSEGVASIRLRAGTGAIPPLADHIIDSHIVFPTAAHIESAILAAKICTPHTDFWLENMRFEHPLTLVSPEESAPQAMIEIAPTNNEFTISSRPADALALAKWKICCRGRVNAVNKMLNVDWEPLDRVRARLKHGRPLDLSKFYSTLNASGIRYGDSFHTLTGLRQLGTDILATVQLPSHFKVEVTRWHIHPILLDACLQAVYADVHYRGDPRFLYLIRSIRAVQIPRPVSELTIQVHIKIRRHQNYKLDCDARLYSKDGTPLGTILGLQLARVSEEHSSPRDYEVILKEESYALGHRSPSQFKKVLVLEENGGPLASFGVSEDEWFPGVTAQLSHPSTAKDVVEALPLDRRTLIVVSALTPAESSVSHLSKMVPTLLHIAQAIHRQKGTPHIVVLTAGAFASQASESCSPASASLAGACRVMANELPSSTIRVIDLPLDPAEWQVDSLKQELQSIRHDWRESTVVLRSFGRFVRQITERRSEMADRVAVTLPEAAAVEAAQPSRLRLHEDKTYLVTGGTGGFGLQIAMFLAERGARRLVLASRSGPKSDEDVAWIDEIKRGGVELLLETVDLGDEDSVKSLLKSYPNISGIIHCAGVLRDAYSYEMSLDDFWAVFYPKAVGAWNLHMATKGNHLDFFVTISSISSVLGMVGQLSYAASNQFLDSLVQYRQSQGLPGLTLNFGVMGDFAGMSRSASGESNTVVELLRLYGLNSTSLPWLLSSLETCMVQGATQCMSANVAWKTFLEAHPHLLRERAFQRIVAGEEKSAASRGSGIQSLDTSAKESKSVNHIIKALQAKVTSIVGVEADSISPQDTIDQFLFDSIVMKQIQGYIRHEFHVSYSLIRLFEGPSLQEMADEISSQLGGDEVLTDAEFMQSDGQGQLPELPQGLELASDWFVRATERPSQRRDKLWLFHPLGAGASFFSRFLVDPPEGLDTVAVQLPGRENRRGEPTPTTIDEIVQGITAEMSAVGPCDIFWGHSFGGIIAFETILALQKAGMPTPRLVVTGTIAPHLVHLWQKRDILLQLMANDSSADHILALLNSVDDPQLVRAMLPQMRKDMPVLASYPSRKKREVPGLSVVAFTAERDEVVYPDEIEPWNLHTSQFRLLKTDGDHWSLRCNQGQLRETLTAMVFQ